MFIPTLFSHFISTFILTSVIKYQDWLLSVSNILVWGLSLKYCHCFIEIQQYQYSSFTFVHEMKYFLIWILNIFVFLGPVIRNWSCFKYPTDSNWLDLTDWKGWRISVKKLTDFIWIDMNCLFRYPSKKIPILSEIIKCQPLLSEI